MSKLILVVHNYAGRGIDCYWSGEQPGDSADVRCSQAEDAVNEFAEANWADTVISDNCIPDLEWKMKRTVAKLFPEIDTEDESQFFSAVYNSQP